MDQLFAPLGLEWQPVSPRLTTRLRIEWSALVLLLGAALAVVALVLSAPAWVLWLLVALTVAGLLFVLWMAARRTRAWGYAERAEDLYIKHGVMVRQLVAVPYGRMQFVDVTAGPLERALHLAEVQLHTATPGTRARIPGLEPDEAARLRDRLARLGEARLAGL
jgi:membrane protein YdbS with pleckstrin-like domain